MAAIDFVSQLRVLGLEVEEVRPDLIIVPYIIPIGRCRGQSARLGFVGFGDFPQNPPGCLHISPRLLPINQTGGAHPNASVHPSPNFGDEWEYWSRPLSHWAQTERNARSVLAHINHLLDTM
jgi:hypothetical protein